MTMPFQAGSRATAAAIDAIVPQAVIKAVDQPLVSSATLAADSALVLPVVAGAAYLFRCYLYFVGASGGDLQWTWTVPAGAILTYQAVHNEGGGTLLNNSALSYGASDVIMAAGGGTGTPEAVQMAGSLLMAAAGGSLQLKWAQGTSNATATTVKAGSHVALWQIT